MVIQFIHWDIKSKELIIWATAIEYIKSTYFILLESGCIRY